VKYSAIYYPLFLAVLLCVCILSCKPQSLNREKHPPRKSERVIVERFQKILDSAHVEGTIVIYNPQDSTYFSNDFNRAEIGRLPASTYKIPNSIIALETGIINNDSTVCIWDGQPRGIEIWEQDLLFKDAFRYSCVPCYQEIARKIGADRMKRMLSKLTYPGMVVNEESIDLFWLQGESRITVLDQLRFLQKLYHSELPISTRTEKIIKKIMIVEQTT